MRQGVMIRFYQPADAPALLEAALDSVAEVGPWLPWCHAGLTLADCRQEETGMMDEETEIVAELQYPFEAELVAGRLAAEGVEAWVDSCGVLGISWLRPGHTGGIAVRVRSTDAEKAREILAAVEEEYEPEVPEQYHEAAIAAACPSCGSVEKRFHRVRPLQAAIPVDRHSLAQLKGPRWECRACGHFWSANDEG